jgi:amidase
MATNKHDWQDIAAAKRASLLASIPSEWLIPKDALPADDVLDVTTFRESSGLLTAKELTITAATAKEIVENLSKGTWTAESVASAFCKAAAIAHQLVS